MFSHFETIFGLGILIRFMLILNLQESSQNGKLRPISFQKSLQSARHACHSEQTKQPFFSYNPCLLDALWSVFYVEYLKIVCNMREVQNK